MSWKTAKLDQLGTVGRGKSGHRPRNDVSLYGGEHPFIQTADIASANYYIEGYKQTYSDKGLAQSKLWTEETLCITIAGENTAKTAVLNFPACFPDSIVGFVPDKEKSDLRFVKHSLDLMKASFRSVSKGATQDNLSLAKILSFDIPIPPVEYQRKVSAILSTYDDLIENNRRRIALLEQAARLLYREWFVHFRFPGHETAKFVDGLPEGWEPRSLIKMAEITMGQSPKSEFYNESGEGLPFHQGVTNYGFRFVEDKMFSTKVSKLANAGDILFSVRAPVGRINFTLNNMVLGRGLSAFRSLTGHQSFLFYCLKNHFFKEDLIGGGAIYAATNKKELENLEVICPSAKLVVAFDKMAGSIDAQIKALSLKNRQLTRARDLLLPRLMDGRLPV
jgi:type I restriction enzyme S subunit